MKTLLVIAIAMSCFSFCPINEKEEPNGRPGFYVLVEDYSARTYQKYLVESKDSVDKIFNNCFNSELRLGEIDSPISIYNVRHNFYVARVTIFDTPRGKKKFKNLKYPEADVKRKAGEPVVF